jgi:hypothetical protein
MSSYVDKIMRDFCFHKIEIRKVYEFQKGGNELMVISKDG